MPITAREAEVLDWLAQQYEPMVALLGQLVDTDSGSYDRAGVARAGEILRAHLEAHGLAVELIGQADGSVSIKATAPPRRPAADNAHVLLLGHRDTVFPKGTAAERPFRVEDKRAYGPGVADMKAGLVMNAFVLEAMARLGGAARPVVSLVTSDEEIASPASRPTIEAAARGARAVFNAEPGRPSGNIVSGRKGAMFLSIEVTGKPAHSGSAHDQGVSAIEELCRKVIELHALTDYASGTTVNVGLIEGGQSINTVAPRAGAKVDVRFKTMAAMAEAEAAIERILGRVHLPGASTRITDKAAFLPLEPTAREPGAVRALRRLRGRARPDDRRRVHRRLGGFRLHRGGRRAHRVRHGSDRREGAQPGRGLPSRQPRPARPGPGARDPAPRLRNAAIAKAMTFAPLRRRPDLSMTCENVRLSQCWEPS